MTVLEILPLGFPWVTFDPFLFCAHHDDDYPAGDEAMRPAASLAGRRLGMDFELRDGWRMYHGHTVPGFPRHPHRGFETVTLARHGLIDHSDSLGGQARFGRGDAQWMTAGRGIVHAEMFPLVNRDAGNRTELFQIWLNLPAEDKLVEPHFEVLWADVIPKLTLRDDEHRETTMALVAGALGDARAPSPPPHSWAARADAHVGIWTIRMAPGAVVTLPPTEPGSNRTLYFFAGESVDVARTPLGSYSAARLKPDEALRLENGPSESELLLLQGRPIGEPVAHHGPFVMNTRSELQQAFVDYQRTGFGGWSLDRDDPVYARESGRFARHADGRVERPNASASGDEP
ncbi:MAG TPA: pirin family protein, partial [Polyangiaceae bacterium]|nr:pirin family protein [Polyangiaceae bacterium]